MSILLASSIAVGVLHALAPDHWLPFVMIGRAQNWSRLRLTAITLVAGVGHVTSSLLIAGIGVGLGIAADRIEVWESHRGNIAALLLIGFGIAYMVWGMKNWGRKHSHGIERARVVSYWTLFALVVLGPCEPLIPLVFAGYGIGWSAVALVFLVFSLSTLSMMLLQVHLATLGISLIRFHWFEHATDVLAGGVIALTGVAIHLLGI